MKKLDEGMDMALETIKLEEWMFALGETMDCLTNGHNVTVPHTWNVEPKTEEYWGLGWYEYCFEAAEEWKNKRIFVSFGSVYHDAEVFVNGVKAGSHTNSGYTPFTVEITEAVKWGESNRLVVSADNRFSETMLPHKRSFDWANDGGMIRPVTMQITGEACIQSIQVTAKPVITGKTRQDNGYAVFGADFEIDSKADVTLRVAWKLYQGCDGALTLVKSGDMPVTNGPARLEGEVLEQISYWHFDAPNLYTLVLELNGAEGCLDTAEVVFGFRDFHAEGCQFYLNGEAVRLCGTEWMPGSDPAYGSAEPKESLEAMIRCLKETNCVFTRFHWQQDDAVYDWCDRHGMLVQEEVPFWGGDPKEAQPQQETIAKQQLAEMVKAHRNHPSIIAWGVGNELESHCKGTIQYIKDAIAFVHKMDPDRLASYVTNRIYDDPSGDAVREGDMIMINDYIGTWHGNRDQYAEWNRVVKENPDKPLVPSEFGLCEPAFTGGDAKRIEIFLEKMTCYRTHENVAGTINFCLNDYRTQMGEDGEGKLRKRVHGSTDLLGNPKPSYYVVQRECSPLIVEREEHAIVLTCRNTLPCHQVKGYYGMVGAFRFEIPTLNPGETYRLEIAEKNCEEKISLYRPNGDLVL